MATRDDERRQLQSIRSRLQRLADGTSKEALQGLVKKYYVMPDHYYGARKPMESEGLGKDSVMGGLQYQRVPVGALGVDGRHRKAQYLCSGMWCCASPAH